MWINVKKKLPKKKTKRVLCSREDGDVVISFFDEKEKSFNIPGVTAWKKLPRCYKQKGKVAIKKLLKGKRSDENKSYF